MTICSPLTKKTCDLICGTLPMTSEGNGRSSIPCGAASPGDRDALPASFLMVGSLRRNSLITCPCSFVIWIERLGGGDGCSEGTWPGAFWTSNTSANIPNIKKMFFMAESFKPVQALLSARRRIRPLPILAEYLPIAHRNEADSVRTSRYSEPDTEPTSAPVNTP